MLYESIGNSYQELKDFPNAEKYFHLASEVNPNSARPHLDLAYLYDNRKDDKKTLEEYYITLLTNPSKDEEWQAKNSLFSKSTSPSFTQAKDLIFSVHREQIRLHPKWEIPHCFLALSYLGLSKYVFDVNLVSSDDARKARIEIEKAVSMNPNSAYVHICLGKFYSYMREKKKMKNEFLKVLTLNPSSDEKFEAESYLEILKSENKK